MNAQSINDTLKEYNLVQEHLFDVVVFEFNLDRNFYRSCDVLVDDNIVDEFTVYLYNWDKADWETYTLPTSKI